MDRLFTKILEEYKKIAFADVNDIVSINEDNKLSFKLQYCSCAVSQIWQVKSKHGNAIKIKMHNKLEALKFLSKHLQSTYDDDTDYLNKILNLSPEKIQDMIDKLKNI